MDFDGNLFPKDIDAGTAPDLFNSSKRSESHILDDLVDGPPLPFRGRRVVQYVYYSHFTTSKTEVGNM